MTDKVENAGDTPKKIVFFSIILFLIIIHGITICVRQDKAIEEIDQDYEPNAFRATFIPYYFIGFYILAVLIYGGVKGIIPPVGIAGYKKLNKLMIWIVLGTTILYLIQVIVHLSVDVTSLIKSRTENSICYCQSVLESLRLTGNAPNQCGYNCRCFVPKEDDRLYDVLVRAPTSSEITKEIKKQGLEVFDGNFVVKSGTYDDNNNLEKLSSDFPNTRIVMVLIQSSAFITVLVSPIFASAVVKKWNKDYFQAAISISFYSFLELIDAFELVDEVIDNIDFYIDKKSLVNAILAFVSIAIFTLPLSSFVLAGTDKNWKGRNFSEILKNYKIFTMCLLNIPFICIRIRIVSLYGALDSDNSSLVSFILIFKEMAMIVIAVIEIYVDWKYESEEKSTNKPPPVNRVAPATKASSVSLTEPHS